MEEDEYKATYNELAAQRCVFEKALSNKQASCSLSQHFCLADREGYACKDAETSSKCSELLKKLRKSSVFVLKTHDVSGPLPHNMEIRVQVGGLQGLAKLFAGETEGLPGLPDIQALVNAAVAKFGSLDSLPYGEIIQSVTQFQGRRRRNR